MARLRQRNALGECQTCGLWPNNAQQYTASCPSGYTGASVTVIIAAGTIYADTTENADELALEEAEEQANAALTCCYGEDPLPDTPDFDSLFDPVPYTGVAQYGVEAVEEIRKDEIDGISELHNWQICQRNDFCDGPEQEDVTQDARYTTRWKVIAETGSSSVEYGIDGSSLNEVPADLFSGVDKSQILTISLSFDANARVAFALQVVAGTIQLRRYVAGVPTTVTFAGDWPRLLYDGILQRDLTNVDLVCFYVREGELKMRFQRDLFATEYDFVAPPLPIEGALRLTKIDRFDAYQYTYFTDVSEAYWLARSAVYPPFSVVVVDLATTTASPAGGSYDSVVVSGGSYTDNALAAASPSGGEYLPQTVSTGPYTDDTTNSASPSGGEYAEVVVAGGSYQDDTTNSVSPTTGEYTEISVNGGTYTDNTTNSASPSGGEYA